MNLFNIYHNKILIFLKKLNQSKLVIIPEKINNLTVELPPKGYSADIACNACMILAKANNMNPLDLAKILKDKMLEDFSEFNKVEISKKGFLNITFNTLFWKNFLEDVIKINNTYGSNKSVEKKYNVEFVSANPTGPLHVGHCRGAVIGDVISNLLLFNGNKVTKEYYVNDYGVQIKNFISSVYHRILELTEKKKFPDRNELYPGDYIIDIAKKIIKSKRIKNFSNFDKIYNSLSEESLELSINLIKNNLKLLGVNHNNFVFESKLIKDDLVSKTINQLKKNKFVYNGKLKAPKGEINKDWKVREQMLFASTIFGDDTDRALQKSDGEWTYFASDIAYHNHKVERNFDNLINILGADHAGYIKRITAATKALSKNKINLICKVSQLVKLFKEGKPFKMSKRKGDYITVEDLINEVGKDSARFMMLNRSNDVELDFDFQKVTEKSKENPIFYIQYAYARINSIFRNLKLKIESPIKLKDNSFNINKYEMEILKKIAEWPRCVNISIQKLEPHRIPFYLYETVTLFHAYWNLGNENKEFRFTSDAKDLNYSRLALLQGLAIVIKNGMNIMGVSTPKSM